MPSYSNVVWLPRTFDESTIDRFIAAIGEPGAGHHLIVDARRNAWIDPTAMVTLAMVGAWLGARGHPRPRLLLPAGEDTRAYWRRMGLIRCAADYFDLHDGRLDPGVAQQGSGIPLTRLSPIGERDGLDSELPNFMESTERLARHLGLTAGDFIALVVAVRDGAAALLEESGNAVWITAQIYNWRRKLGRRLALVALGTHGVIPTAAGLSGTVDVPPDKRDELALQDLVFRGVSRYLAPGERGSEFIMLRRAMKRLDGSLTLRTGTARLSLFPSWLDGEPLVSGLPNLDGILVSLMFPQPK